MQDLLISSVLSDDPVILLMTDGYMLLKKIIKIKLIDLENINNKKVIVVQIFKNGISHSVKLKKLDNQKSENFRKIRVANPIDYDSIIRSVNKTGKFW